MTAQTVRRGKKNSDLAERAFSFACGVVAFNDALAERGPSAARLGKELMKAGTLIGASIEAADVARNRLDFFQELGTALQSARQARYWLRIIQRTGKSKAKDLLPSLLHEAERLVGVLEDSTERLSELKIES